MGEGGPSLCGKRLDMHGGELGVVEGSEWGVREGRASEPAARQQGWEIPFVVNAQCWAFRGISVNTHGILFVAVILDRAYGHW